MTEYDKRFWKKNWDEGLDDLDPSEFDMTYLEAIKPTFENFSDKMAFAFLGVEKTYREFDEYSNQFANMLIENGFEKGDIVGINLPNTPQYLIAWIGAFKAGCIVSGVSPLLSAAQISYQIKDLGSSDKKVALVTLDAIFEGHLTKIANKLSSLKLVIPTNIVDFLPTFKQILAKLLNKVPKGKITALKNKKIIPFKDIIKNYPTSSIDISLTPDDIAYIQYTGGTTGPPKGAMLTHRNSVSNLIVFQKWNHWEDQIGKGVALSGFPFYHIAGLYYAINCVYAAYTQVLIPNPRDTDLICEQFEKYNPTLLANVPSLYQILMKNPQFEDLDFSSIDACITAAAPFPAESQAEFEKIVGKGSLLEVYGMTETSPLSTSDPKNGKRKLGHVGLPLLNTEMKLIDPETRKEVPIGEAGEICVRGPQVMKGYYNKPEETKNALDEDKYMHTGDVGIMDEDGHLKIVDRTKDMINVSGYKVFSSKLEDILAKHPAIDMIATIGVPNPDRPGSELVKAYIQINPKYEYNGDKEKLKKKIIDFAKGKCAPYEVPKIIEFVEEIPLTSVGKIDKKVLRKQMEKESF